MQAARILFRFIKKKLLKSNLLDFLCQNLKKMVRQLAKYYIKHKPVKKINHSVNNGKIKKIAEENS